MTQDQKMDQKHTNFDSTPSSMLALHFNVTNLPLAFEKQVGSH